MRLRDVFDPKRLDEKAPHGLARPGNPTHRRGFRVASKFGLPLVSVNRESQVNSRGNVRRRPSRVCSTSARGAASLCQRSHEDDVLSAICEPEHGTVATGSQGRKASDFFGVTWAGCAGSREESY